MNLENLAIFEKNIARSFFCTLLLPGSVLIFYPFLESWFRFDRYALALIIANVMLVLSFRLFAFPNLQEISRIKHLEGKLNDLSGQPVDIKNIKKKSLCEIFQHPDIKKYSLIEGLISVSMDEEYDLHKLWMTSMGLFFFVAFPYCISNFKEILDPLSPQKIFYLTSSFTISYFVYWGRLIQARSRNLKHCRT